MFSGIIEEIGEIYSIIKTDNLMKIQIIGQNTATKVIQGDSIAVNGTCLTVTNIFNQSIIEFDVMPQTTNLTNLQFLKIKHKVNLETALTINKKINGHILTGHIDCLGKIINIINDKNAILIIIEINTPQLNKFTTNQGSIAINGVSLTVVDITNHKLTVSLIPYTFMHTSFAESKINDFLNIEFDMFAKQICNYIDHLYQNNQILSKLSS